MADNSTQTGTDVIRSIDKGGVKTQAFVVDKGGAGAESLVADDNPYPVKDDESGGLLRRILTLLMSPRGYDKSLARQRVTATVESLPTLTNVTTVATVSNLATIGSVDARLMLINPTNRTSWALNHRSRIT